MGVELRSPWTSPVVPAPEQVDAGTDGRLAGLAAAHTGRRPTAGFAAPSTDQIQTDAELDDRPLADLAATTAGRLHAAGHATPEAEPTQTDAEDPLARLAAATAPGLRGASPATEARPADRIEAELHRLLARVASLPAEAGASARSAELRGEVAFLLARLAFVEGLDVRPEAKRLRLWLGGPVAGARPANASMRAVSHEGGGNGARQLRLGPFSPWEKDRMRASHDAAPQGRPHPNPLPEGGGTGGAVRSGSGLRVALIALLLVALLAAPLGAVLRSYRAYVVLTGSMAPTLPVGTLVVVEPVAADRVAVGDIVTFNRPDRPDETVTHRVVRIEDGPTGRYLQTKGDANNAVDAWRVPASGQLWRYVAAAPWLGRVFQTASDPTGRMAFMVLPSLFLGALTLINTWRGDRRAPTRG